MTLWVKTQRDKYHIQFHFVHYSKSERPWPSFILVWSQRESGLFHLFQGLCCMRALFMLDHCRKQQFECIKQCSKVKLQIHSTYAVFYQRKIYSLIAKHLFSKATNLMPKNAQKISATFVHKLIGTLLSHR